jgi:hypothetical protein
MDAPILEKFMKIAKVAGLSEDVMSKIKDELSKAPKEASVEVEVTAKEPSKEEKSDRICDLTDEDIDKMSESDVKTTLKKARDEAKYVVDNAKKESEMAMPEEKKSLNDVFSKIGSF